MLKTPKKVFGVRGVSSGRPVPSLRREYSRFSELLAHDTHSGVGVARALSLHHGLEVRVFRRRERAGDGVLEDVRDLLGVLADGERGGVDFFEHVPERRRVQHDERLAARRRVPRVEGRVPLPVLLPEPDDDHVTVLQQRPSANQIEPSALGVVVRTLRLVAYRLGFCLSSLLSFRFRVGRTRPTRRTYRG